MLSLYKTIDFVKTQGRRVEDIIARHPEDAHAKQALSPIIANFQKAVENISAANELIVSQREEIERLTSEIGELREKLGTLYKATNNLHLTSKDLLDLPEELLAQLSITESDKQEFEIIDLIEKAGGAMSLDQLLIAIYRKSGEILERTKLNQRIYRMCQKLMLFPIPNKKGAYSLAPIQDGETAE